MFAEADILNRKILFRQAALKHVTILQCIDSVLKAKADHSIPDEFFHDILDEHFSQRRSGTPVRNSDELGTLCRDLRPRSGEWPPGPDRSATRSESAGLSLECAVKPRRPKSAGFSLPLVVLSASRRDVSSCPTF